MFGVFLPFRVGCQLRRDVGVRDGERLPAARPGGNRAAAGRLDPGDDALQKEAVVSIKYPCLLPNSASRDERSGRRQRA